MNSQHADDFGISKYQEFSIMTWKRHPASIKADFDSISNSLSDYKQAILEAAEFIYRGESKFFTYEVTIEPQYLDFEIRVGFPFFKGQGEEKELFRKKRIVEVALISREHSSNKFFRLPFAKVLEWDLAPFKCSDQW